MQTDTAHMSDGSYGRKAAVCGVTRDEATAAGDRITLSWQHTDCEACKAARFADATPATDGRTALKLPRSFWTDHVDRCDDYGCRSVKPLAETARTVTVALTDEQIADLRKDAEWYVSQAGYLDPDVARSVGRWAKTMVNALDRQGV